MIALLFALVLRTPDATFTPGVTRAVTHGSRFNGLAQLEDQEDRCYAKLPRPLHDVWVRWKPSGDGSLPK